MTIEIKYYHPGFNTGIADVRNVWLLTNIPVLLKTAVHQGILVYRMPRSGKRISYRTLKKGLVKKRIIIEQAPDFLPF